MAKKNGSGLPEGVQNEIDEIYRRFAEVERFRTHPDFWRLAEMRQRLVNLMVSVAGIFAAEEAIRTNMQRHLGDLFAAGYTGEDIEAISSTAHEGTEAFSAHPPVGERLEAMLSCYRFALQKLIEALDR